VEAETSFAWLDSTIPAIRSFISRAALLVNVTARILAGLRDQPGDAGGDRAGLACARAREYQHRAILVVDGFDLLGIKIENSKMAHGNSLLANLPTTCG
jgi:hypothetical protein